MKADNRNIFAIKAFLREYLDLRKDKDNELATVDSIRKGVEFKGANLWILIFAILSPHLIWLQFSLHQAYSQFHLKGGKYSPCVCKLQVLS